MEPVVKISASLFSQPKTPPKVFQDEGDVVEVEDEHDDVVGDEDYHILYDQLSQQLKTQLGKLGNHQYGLQNAAPSKTKES